MLCLSQSLADYALKPPQTIAVLKNALEAAIRCFEPHPKLESGWRGLLTLAVEVIDNAIFCWKQKVNGTVLSDLAGVARRFVTSPEKPAMWNGERIQMRPLWVVRMEDGFQFLAPDWFWSIAPLELEFYRRKSKDFLKPVKHALTEYFTDILYDLSKGEILSDEPLGIKKRFEGISQKQSPGVAVGGFIKELVKASTHNFDEVIQIHFARGCIWFPGFHPLRK